MPDNFCRVLIGLPNIDKDLFGASQVWRICRDQTLRRIGVEQGRFQRLTELVREGRRQRPCCGSPVKMHHLEKPLAGFQLCSSATASLKQKPCDDRHLRQRRYEYSCQLPVVSFPNRRLSKLDGAAGRQAGFIDIPTPELPPIIHGWLEPQCGRLDVASTLTPQDSYGDCGTLACDQFGGDKRTTYDTVAKIAIDEAKNGGFRNLVKAREGTFVLLRYTVSVNMDVIVVNGRARRQSCNVLQH